MKSDYLKQNPEKLIRENGRMVGVSFARRKGMSHAIKVEINNRTTMYGLSAGADFDKQYEKAVDFVLEAVGVDISPELKEQMLKTRFQFLKDFKIGYKRITVLDFGSEEK